MNSRQIVKELVQKVLEGNKEADAADAVLNYTNSGMQYHDAVATVASETGMTPSEIYKAFTSGEHIKRKSGYPGYESRGS